MEISRCRTFDTKWRQWQNYQQRNRNSLQYHGVARNRGKCSIAL